MNHDDCLYCKFGGQSKKVYIYISEEPIDCSTVEITGDRLIDIMRWYMGDEHIEINKIYKIIKINK